MTSNSVCGTLVCSKIGGCAPPAGRSQISDFELWDTRDIAERVLRSVRDGSKPNATITHPVHDVFGIPELKI